MTDDVARWAVPADDGSWHRVRLGGHLAWGRTGRPYCSHRLVVGEGWRWLEVHLFGRYVGVYR